MTSLKSVLARAEILRSLMAPRKAVVGLAAAMLLIQGCAEIDELVLKSSDVAPLQFEDQVYTPDDALSTIASVDVLALNDEMREFVELHTEGSNAERNKLMALHMAIKSPAALDISYDPFADGDARTAFNRGSANCLSYAHMFIALAREAGINARYQWMEVRPEWARVGERVAVRLHVNVSVKTRDGFEYLVDIDPLSRGEQAGARIMTDEEGLTLYHNNLAMAALGEDRTVDAWMHLVKGIDAAPEMSQLWVNMGAIYRFTGQYEEAERVYFRALEIDRGDRSAMNNLVFLYEMQGRDEERQYWLDRMRRYRDLNPYYHANLGDIAMEEERWQDAFDHYWKAYKLHPEDGSISYSVGLAAHRMGDDETAMEMIGFAIEKASFQVEKEKYRIQLRAIERQENAVLL